MSENISNNRLADADLLTRVGIALTLRLNHTLHGVHAQVDNGAVTLRGSVGSFYDRQLAFEVTRRVAGVLRVKDELTVVDQKGTVRSKETVNSSNGVGTEATTHSSALTRRPQSAQGWKSLFANAATVVRGLFLAFAVIAAVGCGSSTTEPPVPVFPAGGTITFKGQPIPGAAITLHPTAPVADVPTPSADVTKDGAFSLSTFSKGDGAPEGSYKVTVRWYKLVQQGGAIQAGPNVIPRKYANPETSDIEVRIAAGQNDIPTIKL